MNQDSITQTIQLSRIRAFSQVRLFLDNLKSLGHLQTSLLAIGPSSKIFGSLRSSWKSSKAFRSSYEDFGSLEIFGSLQSSYEDFGSPLKIFESLPVIFGILRKPSGHLTKTSGLWKSSAAFSHLTKISVHL